MASKSSKTNNIYINGKQAGQTLNDLRKESRKLNNEINQMAPGTEAYKKKVQELGGVKKQLTDHRNELKKVEGSYTAVSKSMGGIKNLAGSFLGAGAIIGAVQGIVRGAGEWIKTNAKLSASLSSLEALTGATAKDLEFYSDEAIRMGATTTQSATQVVDAMKLIGSAKPELLGTKEALAEVTEETIRLAEAGQIEVTAAASSLTGALNQWGKGAESAARFTNVFAAGSKSGAAGIESLGQSIDKSGAVMAGFNIEVEQGIGLLETMGEKNITGAEAGTQLRNVLLTMQGVEALSPVALAQLEKFGVDVEIVSDKTLPLNTRLNEMAKISGDATAMMKVFGKENIVSASAILQNTDKVQKYTEAVTDTNVAMEQQRINNDNLEGDLKSWSSAWEGMTLTIGGGEGAIRKLVQTGTNLLNWVTSITKAFQDWDITRIETGLLQLGKTILQMFDVFGILTGGIIDAIDAKIRLNEITSSVIDSMEAEQRSLALLTASLQDNNKQLADGNLTEEETIAVKEENSKIIEKLNKKYPELTSNIDLQSASNEELTNWQKQVSQSILEGAIAEAKAIEQKRILNAIISETIELRKQEIKEAERWAVTNWFADIFADDAEDMRENIEKSKGQLESLEEDFKHVEGTVKDLDLNFVVDFDTANEAIDNQEKRISALRANIKKAQKEGNSSQIKALEAQLKAEISVQENAMQIKKDLKKQELEETKKLEAEAQQEILEENQKAAEKATEVQRKQIEKLQDELKKLKDFEIQINEERNREVALANKEGFDKELLEAQFRIDDKYKKEIESAKLLAQEKGEIGRQGADQLATLELLKLEELMSAKAELQKKQSVEEIKLQEEEAKKRQEAQLRIEDAIWNTRRTVLGLRLDELGAFEVDKKREILEEIANLEREKAKVEAERKKAELEIELENKLIDQEEFDLLTEDLETQHQMRLTEITKAAEDERLAISQERVQQTIDIAQSAIDAYSSLKGAQTEMALDAIETERNAQIKGLDDALDRNLISREDYDAQITALNEEMDAKKRKLQIEEFEREKAIALVKVAIDTASAIIGYLADPGGIPGIALSVAAGVTGIAQGAVIASKTPQFKDGGFTDVIGAQDGKSYNAKVTGKANAGMLNGGPQLVLANEKGPEYFIPNPMLSNPEVIDHVRAIENIRVRQFAEGGATAQLQTTTENSKPVVDKTNDVLIAYLQQNYALMTELRAELTNLKVVIGDDKIDLLMDKMEEITEMRA